MQREQAIEVLKQIMEASNSLACYKSLTLLLHPKNGLSKGYQIQLENGNIEFLQSHVENIAKDNGLAVAKEGKCLIVYRPQHK